MYTLKLYKTLIKHAILKGHILFLIKKGPGQEKIFHNHKDLI